MLLVRRMLFQREERLYRILWVEPTGLTMAIIDVYEEKANPVLMSMSEFSELLDENLILMIKEDPYSANREESSIPEKYKEIAKLLDDKRIARESYMSNMVALVKAKLADAGIEAEVYGRPKHIYSI